jgi:four helix bundle protein
MVSRQPRYLSGMTPGWSCEGVGDQGVGGRCEEKAMTIRSYQDLDVWQKAMDLVEDCYRLTREFPDSEVYGLSSQLQRSAVSIPANIAEGRERGHTKEFLHHLSIAYGSLAEVETHILIARRLNYVSEESAKQLMDRIAEIGRMLNGLRGSLEHKNLVPDPQFLTPAG